MGRGTFSLKVAIPESLANDQQVTLVAYTRDGQAVAAVPLEIVPLPTNTPVPVPPTDTPVPPPQEPAAIEVNPQQGAVGGTVTVTGQHWPAGQTILVTLSHGADKSAMQVNPNAAIARVKVGKNGQFQVKGGIPAGQNWEDAGDILIVAFTADGKYAATAPFKVLTQYKPTLAVDPQAVGVDQPMTLVGQNWPPQAQVHVAIVRRDQRVDLRKLGAGLAVATVGDDKSFQLSVNLPSGQGWEKQRQAVVVAYTHDLQYSATAPLGIVAPEPTVAPTQPPEPTPKPKPTAAPRKQTPARPSKKGPEATPVAPQAQHALIALNPVSGTVGVPITIQGQFWPAGSTVNLALTQPMAPGAPAAPSQPVAQGIPVDAQGQFVYSFAIPAGVGWENLPQIVILAFTNDQKTSASTPFYNVGGGALQELLPPPGATPQGLPPAGP